MRGAVSIVSLKDLLSKVADEGAICERLGATHVTQGVVIGDRERAFPLLVSKVRALLTAMVDDGVTEQACADMLAELDWIVNGVER